MNKIYDELEEAYEKWKRIREQNVVTCDNEADRMMKEQILDENLKRVQNEEKIKR